MHGAKIPQHGMTQCKNGSPPSLPQSKATLRRHAPKIAGGFAPQERKSESTFNTMNHLLTLTGEILAVLLILACGFLLLAL
jgi:hypothetical protein